MAIIGPIGEGLVVADIARRGLLTPSQLSS